MTFPAILSDICSGSQYHGDLSDRDERHGQGILYLTNGAWYEGKWKNNAMHGDYVKYCFENVYHPLILVSWVYREMCTKVLLKGICSAGTVNLFTLMVITTTVLG